VDISDLRARQVDSFDYEAFDYLLAMDERNFDWLRAEAPRAAHERIKRFLEFAPSRTERWVPDPYYGGEDGFGHVFELVDEAATGLLAEVRQRHQL
jgi:protein-tyrosine phosphatase